ncbi:MAG: DUF4136 domain-containing protein [Sphingomonadaceae bacterium]|nr:DUF4136 domain-containing protein [Sphingomonadaceae bacterium]
MNRLLACLVAVSAITAVSGCATDDMATGASVTRFHLGQPIARGPIAVEAADPRDTNGLEFAQISASVARELTRLGWTVVPNNASEQVAMVSLTQQARPAARRSGVTIGIGGGTASYGRHGGVGVGGGVEIPVGGAGPTLVVGSQLSVRIQRRSDATVAWEGRAQMEARGGSPLATRAGAADRLAAALFRDFPGESGRTIRVR